MGAFVIPDNTLGLFWILFFYFLYQTILKRDNRWFLPVDLALGGALLSKYHAVFLIAGLIFILILFREWRGLVTSPWLYGGLLLSGLVFLPNIIWNAQNDFRLNFECFAPVISPYKFFAYLELVTY